MTCTDPDHARQTAALRQLRAAMDRYNLKPNQAAVAFRAPLARLKARPDECPICPPPDGGLTPQTH